LKWLKYAGFIPSILKKCGKIWKIGLLRIFLISLEKLLKIGFLKKQIISKYRPRGGVGPLMGLNCPDHG
jgi:hypothetical protein